MILEKWLDNDIGQAVRSIYLSPQILELLYCFLTMNGK